MTVGFSPIKKLRVHLIVNHGGIYVEKVFGKKGCYLVNYRVTVYSMNQWIIIITVMSVWSTRWWRQGQNAAQVVHHRHLHLLSSTHVSPLNLNRRNYKIVTKVQQKEAWLQNDVLLQSILHSVIQLWLLETKLVIMRQKQLTSTHRIPVTIQCQKITTTFTNKNAHTAPKNNLLQ